MNNKARIIIFVIVAAAVGAVFAYKSKVNGLTCPAAGSGSLVTVKLDTANTEQPSTLDTAQTGLAPTQEAVENKQASTPGALPVPEAGLPLLLDLGSHNCIPCKMMTPILDELKNEYSGKFKVEFIDVRENPAAGDKYNIEAIPTQIFFDGSGKELFRHVGFYPKTEIIKKWQELGVAAQGENKK